MKRRTNVNPCAPADRWRRGEFRIWHYRKGPQPENGYLRGAFAVRRQYRSWIVTHLPSGCMIGPWFDTVRAAKAFAERLDALTGPRGGLSRNWRKIQDECFRARAYAIWGRP